MNSIFSSYNKVRKNNSSSKAFTIVELLIVVVVIAILAAITIVSYNGVTGAAKESSLKSDLKTAQTKAEIAKVNSGTETYPAAQDLDVQESSGNVIQYTRSSDGKSFCMTITNGFLQNKAFTATNSSSVQEGSCDNHSSNPIMSGANIQEVTSTNCPVARTMVKDARDNHTYWIQKMPDDRCWMLTNLAYAGGGNSIYGDTKNLQNGTSDAAVTYTLPKYYIPPNANPTTNPTNPSTSTDGGATNPQYGYLYNWCAAMGGQATAACANAVTPVPDLSISICPASWRLPTGGANWVDHELGLLADSIDAIAFTPLPGGNQYSPQGSLAFREAYLFQFGGGWISSFVSQGVYGTLWSSAQHSATNARYLNIDSLYVQPSMNQAKRATGSVRCVLDS